MSASLNDVPWNLPMGWPNCWRVAAHSVESSSRRSSLPQQPAATQMRPGAQPLVGEVEAGAGLAQDLAGRDTAIIEVELEVAIGALADRPGGRAPSRSPLVPTSTRKEVTCLRSPRGVCSTPVAAKDDGEVGIDRRTDEMFLAGDEPVVAILAGAGLHAHDVGARAGLGEAETFGALARDRGLSDRFRNLVALAGHEEFGGACGDLVQCVGHLAEFTLQDGALDMVEAAAADRFRQIGGIKTHLDGALLDLLGEVVIDVGRLVDGVFVGGMNSCSTNALTESRRRRWSSVRSMFMVPRGVRIVASGCSRKRESCRRSGGSIRTD